MHPLQADGRTSGVAGQLRGAHLLFLNWRDPTHPQAGGAEAYCFEIARRFAAAGVKVTLFASRYPGAAPGGVRDGVGIIRAGGTFGVYAAAARHLLANRREYDAVVDFQNGIPFFTPLFAPRWTPCVCVIHHVHQRQFDVRFTWPLNTVGRLLEKQVSRAVYRGRAIVAVSPSTREETRRGLGFHNPIYLVPNGAAQADFGAAVPRSGTPVIAVVSRMVPQKRVDLLVRAVPQLVDRYGDLRVDVAGDGPELPALCDLAARLGLDGRVRFHGRVSQARRQELLARAWLTVVPSDAEGWGLTVIEAGAVGTPAVAYDVPGLRDAVRPGHTGWLLEPGSDLGEGVGAALAELGDAAVRDDMAQRCREWAGAFSWDGSAERLAGVLVTELRRVHRHRRTRRTPSDMAVVTRFEAEDADAVERELDVSVRATDGRRRDGDRFRLLLHGCDEVLALGVLRRLGVGLRDVELTLARRRDVLVGGSGQAAPDTTDAVAGETRGVDPGGHA